MSLPSPDRLPDDHASHDRQLVVAFACGDLPDEELGDAQALVSRCRRCAALVSDVETISQAIRQDVWAPDRPRDFRVTPDDALRLRGNPLDRLARRLSGPSLRILQPLAGAAVAMGLVLMVATSLMPSFFMASGAAPVSATFADDATLRQAGENDGAGAELAPAAEAPAAAGGLAASPGPSAATSEPASGGGATDTSRTTATMEAEAVPAASIDPVLPLGIGLVLVGAGLLIVLALARRATRDPLLR